MRLKKGDTVMLLSGSQKGETGKITATHPKDNTVVVSGINVRTKHEKPSTKNNNRGGVIKAEMPVPVSKVAIVRPGASKQTTRIGYDFAKDGKKIRIARQAKNKEIK
ncbi:MAG: 50S ribosomal protein L24 [Candidatus Saccharimonadales bacterium]|nr:50S ribosomal protein L24 [Candidatus Saccharimonadales bacterium]